MSHGITIIGGYSEKALVLLWQFEVRAILKQESLGPEFYSD